MVRFRISIYTKTGARGKHGGAVSSPECLELFQLGWPVYFNKKLWLIYKKKLLTIKEVTDRLFGNSKSFLLFESLKHPEMLTHPGAPR